MKNKVFLHPKNRRPPRCIACFQVYQRKEAICNRCSSCQKCGQLNPDKYGNGCIHCGYWIAQERYDTMGPTHKTHDPHNHHGEAD